MPYIENKFFGDVKYIAQAKASGVRLSAMPVKNVAEELLQIEVLAASDVLFFRSNSRATGTFRRGEELLETVYACCLGLTKLPSQKQEVIGLLEEAAYKRFSSGIEQFVAKRARAKEANERGKIIKAEAIALINVMQHHKSLINNLHKIPELNFRPIDNSAFNAKSAQFIYQSPSYYGKQGSSYKLIMVDGRPAYARQSDHWGFFSSRSTEDFDEWNDHVWTLPGSADLRPGERATGFLYLDDFFLPGAGACSPLNNAL